MAQPVHLFDLSKISEKNRQEIIKRFLYLDSLATAIRNLTEVYKNVSPATRIFYNLLLQDEVDRVGREADEWLAKFASEQNAGGQEPPEPVP